MIRISYFSCRHSIVLYPFHHFVVPPPPGGMTYDPSPWEGGSAESGGDGRGTYPAVSAGERVCDSSLDSGK